MDSRSIKLALFLVLVVCVGSTLPMWAQSTSTGTVAGSVTDQSGAVVAGATVTLTDTSTNIARATTTNTTGRYIYVDVTPGIYDITVSKSGFATTKTEKQEVLVGASLTVNLSLQIGGASVVVEVQGAGNELQTMNATVGNTLTSIAIDNLPSIGRDVSTFVELQPGVSTDGAVAGTVNDQSFFSLDGGNNSNDMDGNGTVYTGNQVHQIVGDPTGGVAAQYVGGAGPTGVVPTPADSVEEFKVNTAGQTADFNSSAGAEVKVVTKRGTNSYHGTAYEYYRDNNWSSNSWQNNFNFGEGHIGLPAYHYSRFGGAIGGPIIPFNVLGGKTYAFFNYEGFRFPNSETIDRNVPSPALQLGLLTDSATGAVDYNLNNAPVTYNGTTYPANYGCTGLCDPLGLGLNPLVSQIWSQYEPPSNSGCAQSLCDGANVLGYTANLNIPISSKFAVLRLDHDFSSKEHLMASYRYYNMTYTGDEQVDIGGFFPGDTKGTPASISSDPVQDWYLVAGLTSNITSNTTNDLHYSFLRNWWAWTRTGAPPQIAGLGGALEIMSGQSQTQDLGPFNVNNQQIRRRFWDGHDQMVRDDLSQLHGNHLFQFGGSYQHNFDYHQRNDSGGTINAFPVYSLGDGTNGALLPSGSLPACPDTAGATNSLGATVSINNCDSLAAAVLGVVSVSSQLYTRSGSSLTLNPALTPAFDKSTIPYYNVYFSDTWHLKPTMTLTYGLGWALEMPPTEQNGKQAVVVDQSNEPVSVTDYLATRKRDALAGQVYNPELGFALVGNAAGGLKYPYDPYYGEFSPRIAFAWAPTSGPLANTVLRGGYSRSFGRTNGVDQVLVPLLGLGLEQAVDCTQNLSTPGAAGAYSGNGSCGSTGSANWNNAFRVGSTASATGGPTAPIPFPTPTLPQPVYPGYNNTSSAAPEGLDPHFRSNVLDSFNFTIQHQINRKITLEVGYIGRRITHEYQPIDMNTVPYMMTQGGQTFANAYMNTVLQYCGGIAGMAGGGCAANAGAVSPQPFFETALAGTGYCTGSTNCTQAVLANEGFNIANAQVWSMWSDLDAGVGCPAPGCSSPNGGTDGFNFPRTMENTPIPGSSFGSGGQVSSGIALNASIGYGNYNAGFASVKMADWKGLTMQSNFTWSKALGTGAFVQASSEYTPLDAFDLSSTYGRQGFDRKITYNAFLVYQPPFYKGQSGALGRVLGGWTFATVLTAGTGTPNEIYTNFGDGQSYGGADGVDYFNNENAVPIGPISKHSHAYYCGPITGTAACPGQIPTDGYPINEFKAGANEYMNWRNPILGLDKRNGGVGYLNGLPYWNVDFSVKKNIRVAESVGLELQGVFANVFNHDQQLDAVFSTGLFNPGGWGALQGQAGERQIEVGARVRF
jgi:hypothetical protein